MKRLWAIVLFLPCLLFAQEKSAALVAVRPFTVSLPRNVNPENGLIDYGLRVGEGLSGGMLATRAGVYDYAIKPDSSVSGPLASLKLAIYIPGYRMATLEFTREDLQAGMPFVPQFVPLPTTTLKGRMIDSAGQPVKDEYLKVDYLLSEMCATADCLVGTMHIADTSTDDNGDFSFTLPSLLDDPFFRDTSTPGMFVLSNGKDVRVRKASRDRDSTLNPSSFPLQQTYEPLIIRKTGNGTLSGKLGEEFLRQNNLSELRSSLVYARRRDIVVAGLATITTKELRNRQRRAAPPATNFSAQINADGSFELKVPPGKYDLDLWVSAGNRNISIERDVAIEENQRRAVERP